MREEALYLLRLWRDGDRPEDWRASLEEVRTHHREVFGAVASLVEFLEDRTMGGNGPGSSEVPEEG